MSDNLNSTIHARQNMVLPRGVSVMCDVYAERAENAELWDVQGKRYIDFAAGIAVCNTGHRHPKIVAAMRAQLDKFTHTAFQVMPYELYISLAEKLIALAPGAFPKKAAFFTTGAEAVENAIKVARAASGRAGVIAFSGAFHGRTMLGMTLTGKVAPYKLGFGPFLPDVYHAPFPSTLHGVSEEAAIGALEALFKSDIDPKRVAAIIFEPVQGEGGFYQAPVGFVRALRAICDKHGILLIADEVQTGFARTGKMFAMAHYDVVPDLITVAKSLAGGMPLSGLIGRADIMDAPAPGGLGGTYAGNPMAVASALAVLDIIEEEKLCARAEQLGHALKETLTALAKQVPQIAEIRGPGAMVAMEFMAPGTKTPDADFARRVQAAALKRGLILLTCGVYANVIRFLFPLTIPTHVFEEALTTLSECMLSVASQS